MSKQRPASLSEVTQASALVVLEQSAIVKHDAIGVVPAIIAGLGEQASWRYIEFFTANIRNPNTRRA